MPRVQPGKETWVNGVPVYVDPISDVEREKAREAQRQAEIERNKSDRQRGIEELQRQFITNDPGRNWWPNQYRFGTAEMPYDEMYDYMQNHPNISHDDVIKAYIGDYSDRTGNDNWQRSLNEQIARDGLYGGNPSTALPTRDGDIGRRLQDYSRGTPAGINPESFESGTSELRSMVPDELPQNNMTGTNGAGILQDNSEPAPVERPMRPRPTSPPAYDVMPRTDKIEGV
jgi:hypothetical protein